MKPGRHCLGMFDFDDLDIREFDGDEPEMAELVLAGEESDMIELDASQAPVIGGIEEDDLLHHVRCPLITPMGVPVLVGVSVGVSVLVDVLVGVMVGVPHREA